ncbi:Alpha/Beta hydrolase protein [Ilyonectria sp. MPI-CAGE-AT-0026]|nr:Alpha/Beta hydrolase protein [Ilyonectria sp. MPI-CAGE-AT-0026]
MSEEFECGSLTVPIDHDNTGDGSIDLFVSRRKATGTSRSLGSLVFNNGGPGSGSSVVFQALSIGLPAFPSFSQDILENYDVIAVDTRGIGYSNAISCDKDIWNRAPEVFATNDASFSKLVAFNTDLGESCLKLTGPLAGFMDSVSTAKDFELLRKALGDELLNYMGFSYGTVIGQAYAELYPQHVGRMVLDAVVDHSTPGAISSIMTESQTYQATLEQFFVWCNETVECSLNGRDLPTIFKTLASATSLPAHCEASEGKCKAQITGEDVLFNTQGQLLLVQSPFQNWTGLADAINLAFNGNAKGLSTKLKTDNTETNIGSDYAARAIICQDYGSSFTSSADIKNILGVTSALLPLTRGASEAFAAEAYCASWPASVRYPPQAPNAKQMGRVPPLMLVNAFFDPETSAAWAQSVGQQIPSAVNVWRNGSGHTSYPLQGETRKAIDEFLISGRLPEQGTVFET